MIKPAQSLLDMYIIQDAVLSNSITVSVGDAVIINGSAPEFVTTAAGGTGIVLGTIVTIKGGASQGNTPLQVSTVTTASDNQTVDKISVDILPSQSLTTMIADLDDTAGTTANSQYFGYFNLSGTDSGLLDESTYAAATEKQFLSYGLVPGSTTQVLGVWTKIAQA